MSTWKELREYENGITPKIVYMDGNENGLVGAKIVYKQGIAITCSLLLEIIDNGIMPQSGTKLIFNIREGVDGSGSNPMYNQKGNIDTNNIIMFMFTVLSITYCEDNITFQREAGKFSFLSPSSFLGFGKGV